MKKIILIMLSTVFLSGCFTYSNIGKGQSFSYENKDKKVICSATPDSTTIKAEKSTQQLIVNDVKKNQNAKSVEENKDILTIAAIGLCDKILSQK